MRYFMYRTTIALDNKTIKKIKEVAEAENRTIPNLIQTIILKYLEELYYTNESETEETLKDSSLKRRIKQGIQDYKSKKGRFV